ncbi:major facilitator superfamily domain-containing protein 6-like protein [Dinothrombium tinctorium]|uniref:Major facilitator superfamily domain-containing protein 6-like protein n=1 Tax=Dinothrombium tinctorium TaxID=1965070 RepID=A0A3S3RHV6_9ACAR|nr:major facilitator superfamily domain-containing protein 6-like protein [Dinothrombium tinctorium]
MDMHVLFLKAHYFIWFASLGGILQYVSVFGSQHTQQSTTNIGLLLTVMPFVTLIAKPVFCGIADHFNLHKFTLIASIFTTLLGYGLFAIIPYLQQNIRWYLFCAFVLLANSSSGVVTSLTDSIVMKEVTRTSVSYGSIRVFGSLGWGLFGLFSGVVNNNELLPLNLPYLVPGIIMFAIFNIIDNLTIVFLLNTNSQQNADKLNTEIQLRSVATVEVDNVEIKLQPKRVSVIREVFTAFRKYPSLFQYALITIVIGILTAFHWSFFYLFIEKTIGQDTVLMGVCTFVQCFGGEIVFFLLANRIVKAIGTSWSLNLSLLAFCVRYLWYAFVVTKPLRYILVISEFTQGPAFGLFYCCMTSIAQEYAMKGAKEIEDANDECDSNRKDRYFATMQGIMSGCFEGAGLGIGSAIGGVIIDNWGFTLFWITGACIAVSAALFNFIVELLKRRANSRKAKI